MGKDFNDELVEIEFEIPAHARNIKNLKYD